MFSKEAFIMYARGGLPCETGTVGFAGCEETRRRGRRRVFAFSGGCCTALLRMLFKNFLANHQLDVHFCIEFLCVAYR